MTPDGARDRHELRRGRLRELRPLAAALALVLASSAGGCSFLLVNPPPPRSTWPDPVLPESSEQPCSDTYGFPIVDTITAGAFGAIAYIERNASSNGHADDVSRALSGTFGVAAIPVLASAIYGYFETERCNAYKDRFRAIQ